MWTNVFYLFVTLNGVPQGPTQVILPMDQTCRHEFNMVRGVNQSNLDAGNGRVLYGSCEPRMKNPRSH